MPDPIQSESRATMIYSSSEDDPENRVCSAANAASSAPSAPLEREAPTPQTALEGGAAQLVEQYSSSARGVDPCALKALAAARVCSAAAALATETAPTGIGTLIVAFTAGAECGARLVDAYECYAAPRELR